MNNLQFTIREVKQSPPANKKSAEKRKWEWERKRGNCKLKSIDFYFLNFDFGNGSRKKTNEIVIRSGSA